MKPEHKFKELQVYFFLISQRWG